MAASLALANEETGACGALEQWECDALLRAEDNGYDDLTNNEVWVFKCDSLVADRDGAPLGCGPYETMKNYVSVIILSHVNTTFARVIGFTQTHNLVQAVSYYKVAGILGDGAMVISYDDSPDCSTGGTGGYSVQVSGSSTVELNGGGIFLNSDEVCGFKIPNCADLNIYSGTINSAATIDNIDTGSCTFDPPVSENIGDEPIAIPTGVYWPNVPPECNPSFPTPNPTKLGEIMVGSPPKLTEEWMIYPGYYTDFPQTALVTNKSHIYMHEGVYCVDPPGTQDLSWSPVDAALLNGSSIPAKNKYYGSATDGGVTLYIKAGGGFSLNTLSPTFLDATNDPNSEYQGYLIILEGTPTAHPSCTINGGAAMYINGMVFAPYCNFTINGKAGETADINAQLLGWDLKINGSNEIHFNYDPSNLVIIKRQVGLMR
jgi:hypothetical protein